MTRPGERTDREAGIALPTALLAMLILLMFAGLFTTYANASHRQTRATEGFEVGLHVAESALELGIAAMADLEQPQQPVEIMTRAVDHPDGPRAWAIDNAIAQVTADCGNFSSTAGGDGITLLDSHDGMIYGVGFLPDCQTRTTARVVRVTFDTRPVRPYPVPVTILTGGDVQFDGANTKLMGGLHANGSIIGGPGGAVTGSITAGGSCTNAAAICEPGAEPRGIPNLKARDFWDNRHDPQLGNDLPFFELCPDGRILLGSTVEPCTDGDPVALEPAWRHRTTWQHPSQQVANRNWGPSWVWTANHSPRPGVYYVHEGNFVSEGNAGEGQSEKFTVIAAADRTEIQTNGAHSGNVAIVGNPRFQSAWPGVGISADVDLVITGNIRATGRTTMVFAREQFMFIQNGVTNRLFFVACDASLVSGSFNAEAQDCERDASTRSSPNSPVAVTRIRLNTEFENPGDDPVLLPNTGITGVAEWQALY